MDLFFKSTRRYSRICSLITSTWSTLPFTGWMMQGNVSIAFYVMTGYTPNNRKSSQSFDLFAFRQWSHAVSLLQNSRASRILSKHIPVCPTKFNSTLEICQDRAFSTMLFEHELPSDWFKIYCEWIWRWPSGEEWNVSYPVFDSKFCWAGIFIEVKTVYGFLTNPFNRKWALDNLEVTWLGPSSTTWKAWNSKEQKLSGLHI